MKRSLRRFVENLRQSNDGTLNGGFGSVRGGFSTQIIAPNGSNCSNSAGTCTGTNELNCSNSGTADCTGTSNIQDCSNTGICFF